MAIAPEIRNFLDAAFDLASDSADQPAQHRKTGTFHLNVQQYGRYLCGTSGNCGHAPDVRRSEPKHRASVQVLDSCAKGWIRAFTDHRIPSGSRKERAYQRLGDRLSNVNKVFAVSGAPKFGIENFNPWDHETDELNCKEYSACLQP